MVDLIDNQMGLLFVLLMSKVLFSAGTMIDEFHTGLIAREKVSCSIFYFRSLSIGDMEV